MNFSDPILSCADSQNWEARVLGHDNGLIQDAMERAGRAAGKAILADFAEISPLPDALRVLVLCGTGHNGGDALIAARFILEQHSGAIANVVLVYGEEKLKPQVRRALSSLSESAGERCRIQNWGPAFAVPASNRTYHICLDGVVGMQFKPPLREPAGEVFDWVDSLGDQVLLRAAIDLPSGLGDESSDIGFQADFTYATGVLKQPLVLSRNRGRVGRIRYLDLGFFENEAPWSAQRVIKGSILDSLRRLRDPSSDKRHHGHVFALGGSRPMPGALLMTVMAAVRSGAGLTTAFTPQNISSRLASTVPEAMWIPLPVSPEGALISEECLRLVRRNIARATCIVAGPGLEPDREGRLLVARLVRESELPIVLDAGALQPEVMAAVITRPQTWPPVIVTPHQGEFKRLHPGLDEEDLEKSLLEFCNRYRTLTILKGPVTRVCDGERIYYSTFGGPVLARGGSGDILAGMVAALVGAPGADALTACCRAVAWHGSAAEELARSKGQHAVRTTEILDYLSPAVRKWSA